MIFMSERILCFLNGEVKKYLIPDIEQLNSIRPQGPEGLVACAIPTAMFLFVIVDFFGYLVRNDVAFFVCGCNIHLFLIFWR